MPTTNALVAFTLWTAASVLSFGAEEPTAPPIDAVPELQEIIGGFAYQIPIGIRDEQVLYDAVRQFTEVAKGDRRVMYAQILLFHGVVRQENRMAGDFGPGFFLRELNYTPDEELTIVLPILQRADKYWTRRIERTALARVSEPRNGIEPEFQVFEDYVRTNRSMGDEIFLPVYRYMFYTWPINAVRSIQAIESGPADVESSLSVLQTRFNADLTRDFGPDRVSDEQLTSVLTALSRRPQWWLRALAACTLDNNYFFPADDIISALQKDPHPLVREYAISAATSRVEVKLK